MRKHVHRFVVLVTAAVVTLTALVGAVPTASAEDQPVGHITMSANANVLGGGLLFEPLTIPFYEGDNYAALTDRYFGADNYTTSGPIDSAFYMQKVKLPRDITVNPPDVVKAQVGDIGDSPSRAGQWLGEFDFTSASGWMYLVNNDFPLGASTTFPVDGEVARWQFTVYGYGSDLGVNNGWGTAPLFEGANSDDLTRLVGNINAADDKDAILADADTLAAYNQANTALSTLTVSQAELDAAETALSNAMDDSSGPVIPPSQVDVSTELNASLAKMIQTVPEPKFGTTAGEWTVLSLARSGHAVPAGYFDGYYDRVAAEVTDVTKYPNTPKLHSVKSTENSRLIVALSAIGRDPQNVNSKNMLLPLSDMTFLPKQGINGPIWALIALDTAAYEIPAITDFDPRADPANQTTRQKIVDWILAKEIKTGTAQAGGYALGGTTPDPDMTAMVLQALAPYKEQPAVAGVIDRAVNVLSRLQTAQGGYDSWGSVNSESIAQVIVALTALGIDPATDARFVKAEGNTVTALLRFAVEGGGFRHTMTGNLDGMATDQGAYALVAYDRFTKGRTSLYDMTDITPVEQPQEPGQGVITLTGPDKVWPGAGTKFNVTLSTDGWPTVPESVGSGDYNLLDGVINIPDSVTVTDVTPATGLAGGSLSWNVEGISEPAEAKDKLRVVYTNTTLNPITLTADAWPAELLNITLEVKPDQTQATDAQAVTVGGMTAKVGTAHQFVFDISQAVHEFSLDGGQIKVTPLFAGDGIDLIPATAQASAVTFVNSDQSVPGAPAFNGVPMMYSPEMTATQEGYPTYVVVTTPEIAAGDKLLDAASYTYAAGSQSPEVVFGDTNVDQVINAQDALNEISAWLRVASVTTNQQLVTYNVTSDARINTFDALSVMENYVSGIEFPIILKVKGH